MVKCEYCENTHRDCVLLPFIDLDGKEKYICIKCFKAKLGIRSDILKELGI